MVTVSPQGFRLESHFRFGDDSSKHFEWQSVSGACHAQHQMKGIDVFTLVAPYVGWVPADAEGLDELLGELERRGLLGDPEQVEAAWKQALAGIVDQAVGRLFGADGRDEAERLLEPHRSAPRLALGLLELSGGDLAELRKDAQWAGEEPRDAIYSAWYAAKGGAGSQAR